MNNAAVTYYTSLLDTTAQQAHSVLAVNLVATLQLARALVPLIVANGGGSIVNLSSITAAAHPPGTGLYSASKAAVEALTRAMARAGGRWACAATPWPRGWSRHRGIE